MNRIMWSWAFVGAILSGSLHAQDSTSVNKPYLTVGLFLGRMEEGARIFTPVRLLPFGHPEAGTHQFPTLQQLHGTEFVALIWLGHQLGLGLATTLQRYPTEPVADWPYHDFLQPPDSTRLRTTPTFHRPRAEVPLPGLRIVLYDDRQPILFLIDTRALTLAERGMTSATAMGLDISRADLLHALEQASVHAPSHGLGVVLYDP